MKVDRTSAGMYPVRAEVTMGLCVTMPFTQDKPNADAILPRFDRLDKNATGMDQNTTSCPSMQQQAHAHGKPRRDAIESVSP